MFTKGGPTQYTCSARRVGCLARGWKNLNANVAHNHSPLQATNFEKWHKKDIFVIRIEQKAHRRRNLFKTEPYLGGGLDFF